MNILYKLKTCNEKTQLERRDAVIFHHAIDYYEKLSSHPNFNGFQDYLIDKKRPGVISNTIYFFVVTLRGIWKIAQRDDNELSWEETGGIYCIIPTHPKDINECIRIIKLLKTSHKEVEIKIDISKVQKFVQCIHDHFELYLDTLPPHQDKIDGESQDNTSSYLRLDPKRGKLHIGQDTVSFRKNTKQMNVLELFFSEDGFPLKKELGIEEINDKAILTEADKQCEKISSKPVYEATKSINKKIKEKSNHEKLLSVSNSNYSIDLSLLTTKTL